MSKSVPPVQLCTLLTQTLRWVPLRKVLTNPADHSGRQACRIGFKNIGREMTEAAAAPRLERPPLFRRDHTRVTSKRHQLRMGMGVLVEKMTEHFRCLFS